MRAVNSSTLKTNASATITNVQEEQFYVMGAVQQVTQIQQDYFKELQVTFSGGAIETFSTRNILVLI